MAKIAIVTDAWHPQISGVVTTLTQTIEHLKRMGNDVSVIHPGLFRLTIPCPTYPQIRLAVFPKIRLKRMLDQFQPDHIHIVTEGPIGVAGRFYCRKNRFRFTTSFTTRFDEYVNLRFRIPARWIFYLLRWFHGGASQVMISSKPLREELGQKGFTHTVLWPRGVDTELYRMRDKNFLPDARPIFLYVGRVAVEKNIEAFLTAKLPGTRYVVGNGPDLARLQKEYPKVKFVGAKFGGDLARHYAAADVFVFPSKTDTFGIVMLEAMACGVPVAGYPVRGPIDIVQPGTTGVLGDDLQKAALMALDIDPRKCREFALQYSWQKSAEHFVRNLVAVTE